MTSPSVTGSNNFQLSRTYVLASQGHLLRSGLVISHLKDSNDSEEKKKEKKKLIGLLLFPLVDFLRDESFWSLLYPVLLQPESQVSLDQVAYPQAGWDVTASWRANPRAGQGRSASQELGSWAGWGMFTSWDPWNGGSLSRLRHDNILRTRSLGRLRQVNVLGPPAWIWASPRSLAWPVLGRIKVL